MVVWGYKPELSDEICISEERVKLLFMVHHSQECHLLHNYNHLPSMLLYF